MWTWDQVVQFVVQDYGNFKAHLWLLGFAVLFGFVTSVWKGTITLPDPVGAWIAKEQAKLFSTYCQYITIALVAITSVITAASTGLPIRQAIAVAISTALMGLFGHDAGKAIVKAGVASAGMFALVIACMVVPSTAGCAWLKQVCSAEGLQTLQTVQTMLDDAKIEVENQEATIATLTGIPDATQAQIQAAFAKADAAIAAAQISNTTVQQACSGAGIVAILGDVVAAIEALEPLVLPLIMAAKKPSHAPVCLSLAPQVEAARAHK